jgi:hypothetical protein
VAVINCPLSKSVTVSNVSNNNTDLVKSGISYGASYDSWQYVYSGFFAFDLSGIPAGSTINNATMKLVATAGYNNTSNPFSGLSVSRVTSNWDETTLKFNAFPPHDVVSGQGTPGIPVMSSQVFDWDVTPTINAILASGVNYGFCLAIGYPNQPDSEQQTEHYFQFTGRTSANPSYLQVNYTPPNSAPNTPQPISYSGGNGATFNGGSTINLNWTVSDPDGNNLLQYHLVGSYNDFGTWHYDPGVQSCNVGSGGILSVNIPASALAESNHWSFALMAADSNGAWSNWGYYSYFTVDKTNPYVSSPAGAGNVSVQPGGTFRVWAYGVADALSGVQIVRFPTSRQGAGDWVWKDGTNAGNGNWYCDIPISDHGNAEAVYQTDVYVYDNAGNSPYVGSVFSTVDRTPPTFSSPSVGATPVNVASGQTKAVSVHIADNLSGAAVVDAYYSPNAGGSWTQYLGGVNVSGGVATMIVPITIEGTYYVDFYVRDNAGNNCATWPVRLSFVIDRTAPTIASVQGYSYTNVKTGTRRVWAYGVADALSGVASMAVTYLKPGGVRTAITAYQSNSDWYVDVPLDGATEGEWNVQFQAADRAGNLSAVPTAYFFVDTQRANDPNPGAVWGQTQATLTWSGFADPLPSSGYQNTQLWLGEWDGTSWAGGAPNIYNGAIIDTTGSVSQKAATGLTPGKRYRYTVTYYDKAGNQSAYTWHEFVTKRKIGEQRVKTSSGTVSLPIYDSASGVVGSTAMRAKVASGTGCFELVATNDTNASPLRVKTTQGIWSVSKFGGT